MMISPTDRHQLEYYCNVPVMIKVLFPITVLLFIGLLADAQTLPVKPVSWRLFTPFIFNPAITGSRDFSTIGLTASFQGESNAQLVSADTRLTKTRPGYFASSDLVTFRKTALGGYLFREKNLLYRSSGAAADFAWHLPLNHRNFSFLSLGMAVKGYMNSPATIEGSLSDTHPGDKFLTDMDFGIYYYSSYLYAGFSALNVFTGRTAIASPGDYESPVLREYNYLAGFKIPVSRAADIVLEPSVTGTIDDVESNSTVRDIRPILKLYLQNFCLGTYFDDREKNSFFFRYAYPGFYLGGFFSLPKESPYYGKDVIVEITAAIRLSKKVTE